MPAPLLILIHKMLGHLAIVSAFAGSIIAVDFKDQVTLGSVVVAALIVIAAGFFTMRSKIADIWREEAEGQRLAKERCQEELAEERLSRSEFEKQQQDIRHELKNQNATLVAQLKLLEAKTDLSAALEAIQGIAIAQNKGNDETHRILEEIRDKLPNTPIPITSVDEGEPK